MDLKTHIRLALREIFDMRLTLKLVTPPLQYLLQPILTSKLLKLDPHDIKESRGLKKENYFISLSKHQSVSE